MSIMLPPLSARREHLSNIIQHVKLTFGWRRAHHLAEVPSFVRYGMQFHESGAAYRTRTCDPIITNDVLYQLS